MDKTEYKTDQRELIIEFLKNNTDKYLSVDDIEKHIFKLNKKIGLTTIYRFLNKLEKENKLRIEINNHTKYYQYISDECRNHFHLKCEDCGKIIHFECEEFIKMIDHIETEHKFSIDSKFVIYGLCLDCKNRKGECR